MQGEKAPEQAWLLVVIALFTTHAFDLGHMVIAVWDGLRGVPTQKRFADEAGFLMIGAGLLVVMLLKRWRVGGGDPSTLRADVAIGLVGAFFAIAKETENADREALYRRLFLWFLTSCVFAALLALGGWIERRHPAERPRAMLAAATAIAIGVALTALAQLIRSIAHGLMDPTLPGAMGPSPFDDPGPRFFLFAPTALGFFGTAVVLIATLWAAARPEGSCARVIGAALAIAGFSIFFFFDFLPSKVLDPSGYMAALHPITAFAALGGLVMAPIGAALLWFRAAPDGARTGNALAGFAIGALGGALAVALFAGAPNAPTIAVAAQFVFLHGLVGAALFFAVGVGLGLARGGGGAIIELQPSSRPMRGDGATRPDDPSRARVANAEREGSRS